MPTSLKIKVTKNIIEESKLYGFNIEKCAVARAVRTIFPQARVASWIRPFPRTENFHLIIPLEERVIKWIAEFDSATQEERALLPEIEFEVSLPDEVVNTINLDELTPLLKNHPNLKLINQ